MELGIVVAFDLRRRKILVIASVKLISLTVSSLPFLILVSHSWSLGHQKLWRFLKLVYLILRCLRFWLSSLLFWDILVLKEYKLDIFQVGWGPSISRKIVERTAWIIFLILDLKRTNCSSSFIQAILLRILSALIIKIELTLPHILLHCWLRSRSLKIQKLLLRWYEAFINFILLFVILQFKFLTLNMRNHFAFFFWLSETSSTVSLTLT